MSSAADSTVREFGHNIFIWKIENYNSVAWKEKHEMKSLKFNVRGPRSLLTTWELVLEHDSSAEFNAAFPSSETAPESGSVTLERDTMKSGRFMFYLVRSDARQNPVQVEWRVRYFRTGKELLVVERESSFDKERKQGLDLGSFCDFQRECQCMGPLTFVCQMMVYDEEPEGDSSDSSDDCSEDQDMKMLSEDLKKILEKGEFCDLEIKIGGKSLYACKSILHSSIESLKSTLEESGPVVCFSTMESAAKLTGRLSEESDGVVCVPTSKYDGMLKFRGSFSEDSDEIVYYAITTYDAMLKLFYYLHWGDIIEIINRPSISVYDSILIMKLTKLEEYFAPDKQTLCTKIQAQESTYTFSVSDFSTRDESLVSSPILRSENMDTVWQIHLHPRGLTGESESVAVIVEKIEGKMWTDSCVQCAVLKENETSHSWKSLEWFPGEEKFKSIAFMDRVTLIESLDEDLLRLGLKITMCSGILQNFLMESTNSPATCPDLKSLEKLSDRMTFLCKKEDKYTDVILEVGSEEIKAHKCILAARSGKLSTLLKELKGNRLVFSNIEKLSRITPARLKMIVDYMYFGKILEWHDLLTGMFDVIHYATQLDVPSLRDRLVRCLNMCLETELGNVIAAIKQDFETGSCESSPEASTSADFHEQDLPRKLKEKVDTNLEVKTQTDRIKVGEVTTQTSVSNEESSSQDVVTNIDTRTDNATGSSLIDVSSKGLPEEGLSPADSPKTETGLDLVKGTSMLGKRPSQADTTATGKKANTGPSPFDATGMVKEETNRTAGSKIETGTSPVDDAVMVEEEAIQADITNIGTKVDTKSRIAPSPVDATGNVEEGPSKAKTTTTKVQESKSQEVDIKDEENLNQDATSKTDDNIDHTKVKNVASQACSTKETSTQTKTEIKPEVRISDDLEIQDRT